MGDIPLSLELQDLIDLMASGQSPAVVDVRKLGAYQASDIVIVTAFWRDPASSQGGQTPWMTIAAWWSTASMAIK